MGSASARKPPFPRLHLVTDDAVLAGADFVSRAEAALRAGGARVALHLRGPTTSGARLYELAAHLVPIAGALGARLLVNDRLDVALGSGAHGAQLGARSIGLADARRLLGPTRLFGVSVHSAAEARATAAEGADFLLAGTLFPTASHPGRAGAGTVWLTEIADLPVPVIGIGGVTLERVSEVLGTGAHGVAVLRGVWSTEEPAAAVARHLDCMEGIG